MNTTNYPISAHIICLKKLFDPKDSITNLLNDGEQKCNYVIPFFQRPYEWVWDDEKQLKGLFHTVLGITSDTNDDKEIFVKGDHDQIVFGTLQMNVCKEGLEIIDGQQRITSFWLFIKAIDTLRGEKTDDLAFNVNNQISDLYETQLREVKENNETSESVNRYDKNFTEIKKALKNLAEKQKLDLDALREYLLNNVLFALMITSYKDDVHKTISLFNALNTTGLDLGMKDEFKIQYYDFIRKNCVDVTPQQIFSTINTAYQIIREDSIDRIYHIKENDLIDSFKLWIILNEDNDSNLSKKIKSSPQQYFVESKYNVFNNYSESSAKSLTSFQELAETIRETQDIISSLDNDNSFLKERADAPLLLCTYELLQNCGYWYFRNLLFVFAHAMKKATKNEQTDDRHSNIIRVLEACSAIWKICSIIKTTDYRVKDYHITTIVKQIAIPFIQDPLNSNFTEAAKTYFSLSKSEGMTVEELESYLTEFINVIGGNVFENRQKWFFVALSYLKDCEGTSNFKKQKKNLFYGEKKGRYDIEHIISQIRNGNNKIGNLIFLSSGINKSLGAISKTITDGTEEEKVVKDFLGKIDSDGDHIRNYHTECDENNNIAIVSFLKQNNLDSISTMNGINNITRDAIIKIIEKRYKRKKEEIGDIYSNISCKISESLRLNREFS